MRSCQTSFNAKDNCMRGVLPIDNDNNALGHVTPLYIDGIIEWNDKRKLNYNDRYPIQQIRGSINRIRKRLSCNHRRQTAQKPKNTSQPKNPDEDKFTVGNIQISDWGTCQRFSEKRPMRLLPMMGCEHQQIQDGVLAFRVTFFMSFKNSIPRCNLVVCKIKTQ